MHRDHFQRPRKPVWLNSFVKTEAPFDPSLAEGFESRYAGPGPWLLAYGSAFAAPG